MKSDVKSPSLAQDIGAIAGLYRSLASMVVQRVQYGPRWQERLPDEQLLLPEGHPEHDPQHDRAA